MIDALINAEQTKAYRKYAKDSYITVTTVLALIASTPLFKKFVLDSDKTWVKACTDVFLISTFIFAISALSAGTYNPFIYFRF